jgi:hypothetical protein
MYILFTNARDEPNIAEWIAHHLLLGFDKIIIFDHLSNPPIYKQLNYCIFDGKLIIIRIKKQSAVKIPLMNLAVKLANKENAKWMLYLDADEFLNLNKYKNIKDLCAEYHYADQIAINWVLFGSSNHVKQPKGLITENFLHSNKINNDLIKCLVKPYKVTYASNPHFYNIINLIFKFNKFNKFMHKLSF